MRTDVARVITDGASRSRPLAMRTRVALFAVALGAVTLLACQQDASPDPFVGPSELSLSLALSASPDVLPLDGASQSLVSILARNGTGQVLANVTLRLQTRFDGVLRDFGQLSARTLVTGQDGRALATYTAPLGGSVDTGAQVEILVTPVGDNYASAVPRSLTIRLVPSGIVTPPIPPLAFTLRGTPFSVTPTPPIELSPAVFYAALCLDPAADNCVSDPNSQVVSFLWNFGDGALGSGQSAEHTYQFGGSYLVTLTVADAYERSVSFASSVTVDPIPAISASFTVSPSEPRVGEPVFFNASSSTSPVLIVTFDWDLGDGTTRSGVNVSHTYSVAGTYTVRLTVTDQLGRVKATTQTVTASSSRPTASFVFSPEAPTTRTTVQFNATASSPQAGSGRTITAYAWNFGDGSTTNGVTTSHTFTAPGVYNVVLRVTDSAGETGTTSSRVTVTGGTPTASFVFSPTAPTTTTAVQFNGTASSAPTGRTITGHAWNFGDGSTGTGGTTSHTFTTAGVYNVALTVTDSEGDTDTTSSAVTVTVEASQTPTASFVFSPTAPTTASPVQFNATVSTATAGRTITGYAWNWGDGTADGTGVTPSHTFTTIGVRNVVLTVTDSAGATGTATQAVTVIRGPTASFTASPSPTPLGALTVVDAEASTASDGATITSYTWNFGDTVATFTCSIPAAGGDDPACVATTPQIFSHTYGTPASYTITLTVTDSLGKTNTATQPLVVSP